MSGSIEGGLKARDANLKKNPNFYKDIGKIGGRKGTGHDFGHGKLDPSEMGKRGGKISGARWTPERRKAASERLKGVAGRKRRKR